MEKNKKRKREIAAAFLTSCLHNQKNTHSQPAPLLFQATPLSTTPCRSPCPCASRRWPRRPRRPRRPPRPRPPRAARVRCAGQLGSRARAPPEKKKRDPFSPSTHKHAPTGNYFRGSADAALSKWYGTLTHGFVFVIEEGRARRGWRAWGEARRKKTSGGPGAASARGCWPIPRARADGKRRPACLSALLARKQTALGRPPPPGGGGIALLAMVSGGQQPGRGRPRPPRAGGDGQAAFGRDPQPPALPPRSALTAEPSPPSLHRHRTQQARTASCTCPAACWTRPRCPPT